MELEMEIRGREDRKNFGKGDGFFGGIRYEKWWWVCWRVVVGDEMIDGGSERRRKGKKEYVW